VAFTGIALVALGSAWYHRQPSTDALTWDRLPMTIGFMGVLTAVLEPRLGARTCRALLWPAVAVGIGSVAAWHWTGDLRAYVWVQFAPLLVIAGILALDPRHPMARPLLAALLLYAAAKAFEAADATMLAATNGAMAGHALKHLTAAAACAALLRVAEVSGGPQGMHRHSVPTATSRTATSTPTPRHGSETFTVPGIDHRLSNTKGSPVKPDPNVPPEIR
jgi:hypothetical protein